MRDALDYSGPPHLLGDGGRSVRERFCLLNTAPGRPRSNRLAAGRWMCDVPRPLALRTIPMLTAYRDRDCRPVESLDLSGDRLPDDVVWIDLRDPTDDEARFMRRATGLDVPTRDSLREVESSSRLRAAADGLHLSLPVVIRSGAGKPVAAPLGLILLKDRLVTVRFDELRSFESFRDRLNGRDTRLSRPDDLMVVLLDAIIDRLADLLEEVSADLDVVADGIFGRDDPVPNRRRQDLKLRGTIRRVGSARQFLSKARATLLAVARLVPFVEAEGGDLLSDGPRRGLETLRRDVDSLDEFEARLSDKIQFLLDASLGLINIEQNDTFRVLTIVSVVGIPPTLVASLYGMNFKHMPELDWAWGYPYGLALIAASAIAPLIYFRSRGWL